MGARLRRQVLAAMLRSAGLSSICTSFSASAKVSVETAGPTSGPVPNAGGAPGGGSPGFCSDGIWPIIAVPTSPTEVVTKNSLRDFGMSPPSTGIICADQCIHLIETKCDSIYSESCDFPLQIDESSFW